MAKVLLFAPFCSQCFRIGRATYELYTANEFPWKKSEAKRYALIVFTCSVAEQV